MGGWDQLRARLVGDGEGRAMVVCFETFLDSIRTIPALQHDTSRPDWPPPLPKCFPIAISGKRLPQSARVLT